MAAPTYDLDVDQLDAYEAGMPQVFVIPMNVAFQPLNKEDPTDLIRRAAASLPDISVDDIDDCRPGFIWAVPHKVPPLQRTSLSDVYGRTMSPAAAKECDLAASIWVAVVSVNDGRGARARGQFPSGAIRLEEDIYLPKVEHGVDQPEIAKKPIVDPDYFVDTDFGGQ